MNGSEGVLLMVYCPLMFSLSKYSRLKPINHSCTQSVTVRMWFQRQKWLKSKTSFTIKIKYSRNIKKEFNS